MLTTPYPDTIQALLSGYSSTGENLQTSSQAEVYFFQHPTKPSLFVKQLNPKNAPREADLYAEKIALEWLQGKLSVPRLMGYERAGDLEYMVTVRIPGWPASEHEAKKDIPRLVRLLAKGLQEIHALSFDDCPLDRRVDAGLESVEQLFENGYIDLQNFPEAIRKRTLQSTLDAIRQLQPTHEDVVFTHGDYCLPNILVEDGHLTGFIDLGYAGLADRYRDFISADYSIRRNLGAEWVPVFLDAYGIEIDAEKFAFYQLLHDLI
ncbi:MAG: APH(3') family aminoglycoside O-phosphotransferase [Chloroflexota bacterium]